MSDSVIYGQHCPHQLFQIKLTSLTKALDYDDLLIKGMISEVQVRHSSPSFLTIILFMHLHEDKQYLIIRKDFQINLHDGVNKEVDKSRFLL